MVWFLTNTHTHTHMKHQTWLQSHARCLPGMMAMCVSHSIISSASANRHRHRHWTEPKQCVPIETGKMQAHDHHALTQTHTNYSNNKKSTYTHINESSKHSWVYNKSKNTGRVFFHSFHLTFIYHHPASQEPTLYLDTYYVMSPTEWCSRECLKSYLISKCVYFVCRWKYMFWKWISVYSSLGHCGTLGLKDLMWVLETNISNRRNVFFLLLLWMLVLNMHPADFVQGHGVFPWRRSWWD